MFTQPLRRLCSFVIQHCYKSQKMDFGFQPVEKESLLSYRSSGEQKKNFVVSVEGNIGCGKTAMLNYFRNFQNCEVLAEPVEKWRNIQGHNLLELMYQDPGRWGLALQTYIQLTMMQVHTQPQEKPVRLIERSIYSAKYCFVENLLRSGKMSKVEFCILSEWFNWILQSQKVHLDLIVYLQTEPDILQARIHKRSRKEEMEIPLNYLQTLHQLHEDWLVHHKFPCPAPVLIIDANVELEKMVQTYELHRDRILNMTSQSVFS